MLGPFRVFAVSIIVALSPAFNYAFLGRAVFLMCFVFTVLISFLFAPRSWACALVHEVGVCARASVCLFVFLFLFLPLSLSLSFLSLSGCLHLFPDAAVLAVDGSHVTLGGAFAGGGFCVVS